jgi:hypothetical protein
LLDLAARRCADLLRDRLAALEQQHGGDSADAIAARRVRVLVNVELGDGDLFAELGGDFLERRGDHPARAAPFRPEIDQHRPGCPQYVGGEALVGDRLGTHGGESPVKG